jgi:hypothetical protein
MITAQHLPKTVVVEDVAEAACQAAFKTIADALEAAGYEVTGDFAPEEVIALDEQFQTYVRAMAINNPTIAAMQHGGQRGELIRRIQSGLDDWAQGRNASPDDRDHVLDACSVLGLDPGAVDVDGIAEELYELCGEDVETIEELADWLLERVP